MNQQGKQDCDHIKLCVDCFNCKKKKNETYCKIGVWKEKGDKTILHSPYDFSCPHFDEA